jgi:hypothetical protein
LRKATQIYRNFPFRFYVNDGFGFKAWVITDGGEYIFDSTKLSPVEQEELDRHSERISIINYTTPRIFFIAYPDEEFMNFMAVMKEKYPKALTPCM